jgi:geranylgeranyl diphosphate synthase type II
VRYALAGGGKRIRPVLCLATAEAAGVDAEVALPAAAALELVHSFSLVHDDLPALDDDDERRGRPTVHVRYGEDVAILAGDALLAEAFRLALSYATPDVARELAQATLGMIGGQHLDLRGGADHETVNRLKTGRLFDASVACGLWAAGVPAGEQASWRAFAEELGPLFQTVDDLLDGDGTVADEAGRGRRGCARTRGARRNPRGHGRAGGARRGARSADVLSAYQVRTWHVPGSCQVQGHVRSGHWRARAASLASHP